MQTSIFDFCLPEELIADKPMEKRDSSRLLHIKQNNVFENLSFCNLPSLLRRGDLMVFNDTKVIPARLIGQKNEAKIEANLHKKMSDNVWKAFVKPAKKLKIGDIFTVADDFFAEVTEKLEGGEVVLKFNNNIKNIDYYLDKYGKMPLPPYILKKRKITSNDNESYQTIYARNRGAIAAPTAGLHFTESIFGELDKLNIERVFITLHVGAGTFLPVKTNDITQHKMHSEYFNISPEAAAKINQVKKSGGRIVSVGTTSLRALESVADEAGIVREYSGETDIFITPGYKFRVVDLLVTNFHLPRSTLFMLVCAFAGIDKMKSAYQYAIQQKYRFYSYGDACLTKRN